MCLLKPTRIVFPPKASFTNVNRSPCSSSPRKITITVPFNQQASLRREKAGWQKPEKKLRRLQTCQDKTSNGRSFMRISATLKPPHLAAFVLARRDNPETGFKSRRKGEETKRMYGDPQSGCTAVANKTLSKRPKERVKEIHQSINNYPCC